jgi:hypothetical protein
MKAILEFNLPEEQSEFNDAVNGGKWSFAMWKVDQELRAKTKYAPDTMSEETYKALHEIRDFLHEQMSEQGLKFD